MMPVLFFFEDQDEIVDRVAAQMGCTADEALEHMEFFDRMAVATFSVGNDYPRESLH